PTPFWTVSSTTLIASSSPAKACVGPKQSNRGRLDPTPQPVTTIHRPARLATRPASFRYGGRHHSGIPGGIIPLHPGGFVGISTVSQRRQTRGFRGLARCALSRSRIPALGERQVV